MDLLDRLASQGGNPFSKVLLPSVVGPSRLCSDPDPDPGSHVYSDPDPAPGSE